MSKTVFTIHICGKARVRKYQPNPVRVFRNCKAYSRKAKHAAARFED